MSIKLFKGQHSVSLYVHVPFCKVKCAYCDFYSQKSSGRGTVYLESIKREVALLKQEYPIIFSIPVKTVFIGGGTPSVLSVEEWRELSEIIHSFNLSALKEWTIECNPESFSEEKGEAYLSSGVNRLSFGVQSLNDAELRLIGRAHSAQRVAEVLSMPLLRSFDAVSCDLIYGLPSQSLSSLKSTVDTLVSYDVVKHISAYELTLAEGTVLADNRASYTLPGDEVLLSMSTEIKAMLQQRGFEQYEVSNYALPGFASLHNSAYWIREPYLGLGPAAHSFDGTYRFSNSASLSEYCSSLQRDELPHQGYDLVTPQESLEEFFFLRLRMSTGFHERDFSSQFQQDFNCGARVASISQLVEEQLLAHCNGRWFCTDRGLDMVDAIALKLLDE